MNTTLINYLVLTLFCSVWSNFENFSKTFKSKGFLNGGVLMFSLSSWVIESEDNYCCTPTTFLSNTKYNIRVHHLLAGEAAMTVWEDEPSWSSTWELLLVLTLLVLPSSSEDIVELQSDPTVILDSGLSETLFMVNNHATSIQFIITHHHCCSLWCFRPLDDLQPPRSCCWRCPD